MDIQFKQITKKFGELTVLKDFSLTIPENTISCITGPSGCGKTTLLHLILGLQKPDSGQISGTDDKKFSAVFQENRLCSHLDAVQNVLLVCRKGLSRSDIEKSFEQIGLNDYKSKPVASLSGGMKRRVAILRALMADSNCIILDEPFKELDDALKSQVIEYVLNKTIGKTVILVTHDLDEARAMESNMIYL